MTTTHKTKHPTPTMKFLIEDLKRWYSTIHRELESEDAEDALDTLIHFIVPNNTMYQDLPFHVQMSLVANDERYVRGDMPEMEEREHINRMWRLLKNKEKKDLESYVKNKFIGTSNHKTILTIELQEKNASLRIMEATLNNLENDVRQQIPIIEGIPATIDTDILIQAVKQQMLRTSTQIDNIRYELENMDKQNN